MSVMEGGEDFLWESPHHSKVSVFSDIETGDHESMDLGTQNLPEVKNLPHSVVAHGWIPFMVSSSLIVDCHKMSHVPGGDHGLPGVLRPLRDLVSLRPTSPQSPRNLHDCSLGSVHQPGHHRDGPCGCVPRLLYEEQ